MDVDRIAFGPRLLEILEAISEARFVSFDFEFSGISSKNTVNKKPTLQDRYVETKEAAERYTILQIGLTCAKENLADDNYILRPYNFSLSPLIKEDKRDIDIDRMISYQSGAVEFLLRNGFRMELPYTEGIPYLSREEAKLAKEKAMASFDRANVDDVQLKLDDIQALEFVEKCRRYIRLWQETGKVSPQCTNN